VTPELISAISTGSTGILVGIAGLLASRTRRVAEDQRILKRQVRATMVQNRRLQRHVVALTQHVFILEMQLAALGANVPERPPILELEIPDDEEPDEPPSDGGGPAQPPGGAHRA
jgi:hypothetical protein